MRAARGAELGCRCDSSINPDFPQTDAVLIIGANEVSAGADSCSLEFTNSFTFST
jgi:hypothetical protein